MYLSRALRLEPGKNSIREALGRAEFALGHYEAAAQALRGPRRRRARQRLRPLRPRALPSPARAWGRGAGVTCGWPAPCTRSAPSTASTSTASTDAAGHSPGAGEAAPAAGKPAGARRPLRRNGRRDGLSRRVGGGGGGPATAAAPPNGPPAALASALATGAPSGPAGRRPRASGPTCAIASRIVDALLDRRVRVEQAR